MWTRRTGYGLSRGLLMEPTMGDHQLVRHITTVALYRGRRLPSMRSRLGVSTTADATDAPGHVQFGPTLDALPCTMSSSVSVWGSPCYAGTHQCGLPHIRLAQVRCKLQECLGHEGQAPPSQSELSAAAAQGVSVVEGLSDSTAEVLIGVR